MKESADNATFSKIFTGGKEVQTVSVQYFSNFSSSIAHRDKVGGGGYMLNYRHQDLLKDFRADPVSKLLLKLLLILLLILSSLNLN